MTDANFMEADCVHGGVWHDCDQCSADDQEIRDAERRTPDATDPGAIVRRQTWGWPSVTNVTTE